MIAVGNGLTAIAIGSLIFAAFSGDDFRLSGRTYYCVILGFVTAGAVVRSLA